MISKSALIANYSLCTDGGYLREFLYSPLYCFGLIQRFPKLLESARLGDMIQGGSFVQQRGGTWDCSYSRTSSGPFLCI